MLQIVKTKDELKKELDFFVWDFKIGDNILYNTTVLYELVDDFNINNKSYGKPISTISISIIEAIMVDFIYRLYSGTNHFPESLKDQEGEVKLKLRGETIKRKHIDLDGQEHEYLVLKNFNFSPMIQVYEELKLFGDNKIIYQSLEKLAFFRNRIHINNYFNNFEKDENETFSKKRVQITLNIMIWIFDYFKIHYPRPWKNI